MVSRAAVRRATGVDDWLKLTARERWIGIGVTTAILVGMGGLWWWAKPPGVEEVAAEVVENVQKMGQDKPDTVMQLQCYEGQRVGGLLKLNCWVEPAEEEGPP